MTRRFQYFIFALIAALVFVKAPIFALGPEYPGINIKVQPGKILGRTSTGTGKVEYITPGTGLVMTNGILASTVTSGGLPPIAAPSQNPGRPSGTSPIIGAATIVNGGTGYYPNDYIQVLGGTGNSPAYFVVEAVALYSVDIDNPGTGYQIGDTLRLNTSGQIDAVIFVNTVGGGGEITSAYITSDSQYYSYDLGGLANPEPLTTISSSGVDATVTNIVFSVASLTLYADGDYNVIPGWPAATTNLYNGSASGLTVRPWDVGSYEEGDTITMEGGTTATVESVTVVDVIIDNPGYGYSEGDLLRSYGVAQTAIFEITSVDALGRVQGVRIRNGGRFWRNAHGGNEENYPYARLRDADELTWLYVQGNPELLRLTPIYGVYNAEITSAGSFSGRNPVAQTSTSGRGTGATFNLLTQSGGDGFAIDITDENATYDYNGTTLEDGGFYPVYEYDLSYGIKGYTDDRRRLFTIAREHGFDIDFKATLSYYDSYSEQYVLFGAESWAQSPSFFANQFDFGIVYIDAVITPAGFYRHGTMSGYSDSVWTVAEHEYNADYINCRKSPDTIIASDNGAVMLITRLSATLLPMPEVPQTIWDATGLEYYYSLYDNMQYLNTKGGDVTVLRERIQATKDLRYFERYEFEMTGNLNFNGFSKLEYLDVDYTYVSAVDLRGCESLDTIYVYNCPITSIQVDRLPKCNYFDADNCSLDETSVGAIISALDANDLTDGYLYLSGPYNAYPPLSAYAHITSLQDKGWIIEYND